MPQAVLRLLDKIVDLGAPVKFNGEDMTWRELLSSPAGVWFTLIVIGVPLILMGCYVWQGRKHRRHADAIGRDMHETIGEVTAIYWERTNKRSRNEATQGINYARISYSAGGSEYFIKTVAGDLKSKDRVRVFYSSQNPDKALIERDYRAYKKDSGLKGAAAFFGTLALFAVFVVIVINL